MNLLERITIQPDVRSGKQCIAGTLISVYNILEHLSGGMTQSERLEDFPQLEPDDVRAVLEFAASPQSRRETRGSRDSSAWLMSGDVGNTQGFA